MHLKVLLTNLLDESCEGLIVCKWSDPALDQRKGPETIYFIGAYVNIIPDILDSVLLSVYETGGFRLSGQKLNHGGTVYI